MEDYITGMLQNRLCEYALGDSLQTTVTNKRHDLGNKHFRDGVESCIRSKLVVDEHFHLDPVSSLRYLNFNGRAWGRDTETWVRTAPSMFISRSTGWDFQECQNGDAMEMIDEAFASIRSSQDKRGLHLASELPPDAARLLDKAAEIFPELKFWLDFTQEWEGVVYELTHLARGMFGANGRVLVCQRSREEWERHGVQRIGKYWRDLRDEHIMRRFVPNSKCRLTISDICVAKS